MLILFQTPNIIFVIQNAGVKFYAAQALIRYPSLLILCSLFMTELG